MDDEGVERTWGGGAGLGFRGATNTLFLDGAGHLWFVHFSVYMLYLNYEMLKNM